VLGALERGRLTPAWLRSRWLRAAEHHGDFTFAAFMALSDGTDQGCRDLLFQLRIQWISPGILATHTAVGCLVPRLNDTGLPIPVQEALHKSVKAIVERKGPATVRRYLSDVLRRGAMSESWFRAFLRNGSASPVSLAILTTGSERDTNPQILFRLQLALANIIRTFSIETGTLETL
jgi:hypothetical protein